jgi:predicted dehydrogenase
MGRNHARVLGELPGVELVGIADPWAHSARPDLLPSVEALVHLGLDYCVVAVPTHLHEQIGATLADAGVHALVEKPLAHEPESARRLAMAFTSRGLIGAVGHIERFNPALREARRRIEAGELGRILQISTRRQGPFPARIADVGVVKDLATHDIDLTSWVAQSQYVSVSARVAHRSGRDHEDLVSVVGTLADGTITSHVVNWLSPFKERVAVFTGEKGAFVVDTLSADLTFHANGTVLSEWEEIARFRGVSEGDVVRFAIQKPEPLKVEHECMRDAVLGLAADVVTMECGVATVEVAEAILTSAATESTIGLRRVQGAVA